MKRILFYAVLGMLTLVDLSRAELPPGAYEELLKDATEVYQLRIEKVDQQPDQKSGVQNFLCTAKIIAVDRSTVGRQAGDTIQFATYFVPPEVSRRGFVGPQSPPLLKAGWEGRVYLNSPTEGTTLQLAAYGRSFVPGEKGASAGTAQRGATLGITSRPAATGLEVLSVRRDSLADDLGLRPGDCVLKINGRDISAPADVKEALAADAARVTINLLRRQRALELSLTR